MSRFSRLKLRWAPQAQDFRQRVVYPWETPSIMRRHILTGAMGNVHLTLTSGIFLIAFGNNLGVTIFQWGLLGAVTSFALAFQLVSAHWSARAGRRKILWFGSEFTARVLRAFSLIGAYYLYKRGHTEAAPLALLGLMSISSVFNAFSVPPWYSWLTDIIPEKSHGTFMGRRDAWISFATLAVTLPAGYLIDRAADFEKTDVVADVFLVGILFGFLDLILHRVIPEPPMQPDARVSFTERVRVPLRDSGFRPWLVFLMCWNFSMTLAGALCNVYFVEDLRIRDSFFTGTFVLVALPFVAVIFTAGWTGALVDRIGIHRVLLWSHLLWATLPLYWIVATPATAAFWLGVNSVIGGLASAPAINATNKLLSRVPPPHLRGMYMAVAACLNSLAGGLGALVGGIFLSVLEGGRWDVLGWQVVPFHLLFIASMVLRFGSWTLLFRVRPPAIDVVLPLRKAA